MGQKNEEVESVKVNVLHIDLLRVASMQHIVWNLIDSPIHFDVLLNVNVLLFSQWALHCFTLVKNLKFLSCLLNQRERKLKPYVEKKYVFLVPNYLRKLKLSLQNAFIFCLRPFKKTHKKTSVYLWVTMTVINLYYNNNRVWTGRCC